MSSPSNWPLSDESIRFIVPAFLVSKMVDDSLTSDFYPTAMGYYPHARGHHMNRQDPDDHLLIYCVNGIGSVSAGGNLYHVEPGDVVLLPPGEAHDYSASRNAPWTIYWLHFRGLRAADFCQHVGAKEDERVVRVGVIPAVIALFNDILAVRHTGYSSLSFVHAASQIRQLFTQIAIEAQMPSVNRSTLDLSSVQTFMRDNLHRALDLEALARVAGLSKFHFSHRYNLATGYSPMRHFTHMKMEAACRLLDTTDHSVQRVASALSFDDPLYFSRVFRKVIGCSPQQYRASNLR